MPQDIPNNKNFRGWNFKGKDLTGADFSGADIRGANFTNANLTGANFSNAKAGLQKRWVFGLMIAVLLLVGLSGYLWASKYTLVLLVTTASPRERFFVYFQLSMGFLFTIVTIRQGIAFSFGSLIITGIITLSLVGYTVISTTSIDVLFLTFAFAILITTLFLITFNLTGFIVGIGVIAGVELISIITCYSLSLISSFLIAKNIFITHLSIFIIITLLVNLFSAYIAWQAIKGNPKQAPIRNIAVAFAATGGTSFRGANLTDANFTGATLKNTDFRQAKLIRTCFRDTKKLDLARPGNSYLKNLDLQKLLVGIVDTKNTKKSNQSINKNCDRMNLRGINLQNTNLQDFSFIAADLSEANLQDTDLSRAKLVQTQLDGTDLTGATLTGAFIEDWGLTTDTKLDGVRCDFVFMRLPPEKRPAFLPLPPQEQLDENRQREPSDWNKNFGDGDFADFIAPLKQTLNLFHNKPVDPRLVAIAFQKLKEAHPEADLEIVGVDKKGKNRDRLHIKAEANGINDAAALHADYFANLDELQALPPAVLQAILAERGAVIRMLAGLLEGKQASQIHIQNSPNQNQENNNMNNSGNNRHINTGRDYRETNVNDQGTYVEGDYHNNSQQKQSLAEAAAEIQNLLEQLDKSYPSDTTTGKMEIATRAIEYIDSNPDLATRLSSALKAGSVQAFTQFLNHPAASFVVGALDDWQKTKR
ncbi:pentapeptide repeat-containing protein [Brunnivagina elsteri]|uniref:Low-complexity protein n=1 Tax=Brunnivagina elsteri CCALA 953 TaxID=987040 RepID=A0A2A2THT1_9CYAN|nr:pentapeptide repeat-containing protein [Calothrix elsteri]PAX53188.1 hypothetical protein CK510_15355 [Calothrix elsteri CCALA 953]